jgi:hypothetical protein
MKGSDRAKKKNGIFFVKQGVDSSNCRLNAVNAFFQREKLSRTGFERNADEFDKQFGSCGSKDFTSFARNEEGRLECVVTFIVAKEGKYRCVTRLAGDEETEYDEADEVGEEDMLEAVFVFDSEHMWVQRRIENRWYEIDSRSDGPRQIKRPACDANRGHIFVYRVAKAVVAEQLKPKKVRAKKPVVAGAVVTRAKRQGDPHALDL